MKLFFQLSTQFKKKQYFFNIKTFNFVHGLREKHHTLRQKCEWIRDPEECIIDVCDCLDGRITIAIIRDESWN